MKFDEARVGNELASRAAALYLYRSRRYRAQSLRPQSNHCRILAGILVQKSCRFVVADFYLEVLVVFYRLLWVTKNRHKKSAVRLGLILGVPTVENSAMVWCLGERRWKKSAIVWG